jgi:hypothetical protein
MNATVLDSTTLRLATHTLLAQTAEIVEDDDISADLGLLETGAEVMCDFYEIPLDTAEQIYNHALYWIARTQGHHPALYVHDTVTQHGISQLEKAPRQQQIQILRQAAIDVVPLFP